MMCTDVIKKAVEKAAASRHSVTQLKSDNPLVSSTCQACSVYLTALETLAQLRLNIVAGMTLYLAHDTRRYDSVAVVIVVVVVVVTVVVAVFTSLWWKCSRNYDSIVICMIA